jgi:uncharacterized protein with von Willebrand factor type A (vWA) domain
LDPPVRRLSERVQWFGRRLKGRGVPVTTTGLQDALKSLTCIRMTRKDDFKIALRANLVSRMEDLGLFEQEFERFWTLQNEKGERPLNRPEFQCADSGGGPGQDPGGQTDNPRKAGFRYNRKERLALRDFKDWEIADWPEASAWLDRWVHPFLIRLTRRYTAGGGSLLEIRKMLHRSLRSGGEVLDLAYRQKRPKPRRLIFLADVSGSMEPYSRLFFLFVQAWMRTPLPVEIFAFSTRLTRLTPWLRHWSREELLDTVGQRVPQWSSGTRIGEALEGFIAKFGNKLLGRRSLPVIFSDGWDLGDPARLRLALGRLRRRCPKLFWLNPLMGGPEYQPLCLGMATALPFIDRLLPAHNLQALERTFRQLEEWVVP